MGTPGKDAPPGREAVGAPSPWLADEEPRAPQLDGSLRVDVAVIGAGYTGLSSALALRAEGLRVAVVEADVAGAGASSRNAGHLSPTIGKDPPSLVRLFGKQLARSLLAFAEEAVAETERLIAVHAIDCDFEPVGNVFAAVDPKQFRAVEAAADTAASLGLPGELLGRDAMEQRGVPPAFLLGYFEPSGGVLNPAKYLCGLRRAAIRSGVLLFERSPVMRVDPSRIVTVGTPDGEVTARHAVVATNGYNLVPLNSGLDDAVPEVAPIHVQLLRTAPLSAAELEAACWPGRQGIYTAHEILENYRLTADDRIVAGSKHIRYGFGGRALPDVDRRIADRLEQMLRARFPTLREVAIEDHWGGRTGFPLTFLPQVGRAGPHHNVLYSVGYAGHGLAQGSYAGRMVADLLAGRDGPGSAVWERRQIRLPQEPVRWLVAQGITRMLEALDARVDRGAFQR